MHTIDGTQQGQVTLKRRRALNLLAIVSLGIILAVLLMPAPGETRAQGPDGGITTQAALSTAFTYQGYLAHDGTPVDGQAQCDAQFSLWETDTDDVQLGDTQTVLNIDFNHGYFTVTLNESGQFGAQAFDGQARWLGIAVRCPAGSGGYSTLGRQALTAAPYALYSRSTGALQGYTVSATAPSVDQVLKWNGTAWSPAADEAGAGGDITEVNAGDGLSGGGTSGAVTLTVTFAGSGSANAAARADHDHDAAYAGIDHTHGGADITSPVQEAVTATWATTATYADGAFNADTLDGQHASAFQQRVGGSCSVGAAIRQIGVDGSVVCQAGNTYAAGNQLTLTGNRFDVVEGVASGLDADLLDGQHASGFSTAAHTHWGQTWSGSGVGLTLGGGTTGLSGSGSTYGVTGSGNTGVYGTGYTGVSGSGSGGGSIGVSGSGTTGVVGSGGGTGVSGSGSTYGVFGSGTAGGSTGVYGTGSTGVSGTGSTGVSGTGSITGVSGIGSGGGSTGVSGSGSTYGLYGSGNTGVYGTGSTGVSGSGSGYGVYGSGTAGSSTGVYGTGSTYGLYGTGSTGVYGNGSTGVVGSGGGTGVSGSGSTYGLYGSGGTYGIYGTGGTGVFGVGSSGGRFIGTSGGPALQVENNAGGDLIWALNSGDRKFQVMGSGEVFADGGYHCGRDDGGNALYIDENTSCMYDNSPADFAEVLPAAAKAEPGDVLAIGSDGRLALSSKPYQSGVAGVYSTRPSYLGGAVNLGRDGYVPLAVVGVVPVKVSAENGAIQPGDLLTTSSTPGHAMKASPVIMNGLAFYPTGAIVGKALGGLDQGTGVISMLVMLQ